MAGKRKGFEDTRGTLFYEIARIAKSKRPKYMVLENVKGLLSHDDGKTFATILSAIWELGYEYQCGLVNSRYFGVPQNRERIIIVCNLRGERRPKVFPLAECSGKNNEQVVSTAIDSNYFKGFDKHGQRTGIMIHPEISIGTLRTHKDGEGFREMSDAVAPTIPARAREDGSGQPVVRVPLKFLDRNQVNMDGDYSFTVDTANTGGVSVEGNIRRLTPTECERLQAFPDSWTAKGIIDGKEVIVSDSQRYKMCGNAVTTTVIERVIYELLSSI